MKTAWLAISMILVGTAGALSACSDDDTDSSGAAGSGNAAGSGGGAASQTPPQGADAVEAWLKTGDYKKWRCETDKHASRSPSPHGFNRICTNDAISNTATGDWPEGAAAVKELFADASAAEPVGYAVYLKTKADSAGGANWYWYERVPLDSAAPHDDKGVVADGMGDKGPAKDICVGCHAAAGVDAAHTPTPGGRDQVYTPVK